MDWDLWVDYHRHDAAGLTHASTRDTEIELVAGEYIVVGNEEADPAVAEVVSIDERGVVLVRVLPGPADEHIGLVRPRTQRTA
ncbi:MAG: hypothetical protein ACRD0Q_02915 [Acidimicrobiales bacterium]